MVGNEEFIGLIDQLYDEIMIYDNNFNMVYVNNACERHYGLKQSDMIGKTLFDFDGSYWGHSILPYVYKTKRAVKQSQETNMGAKLATIAIPILDEHEEVKYVVMSVRDELINEIGQDVISLEEIGFEALKNSDNELIYQSEKMNKVIMMTDEILNISSPCLLTGESGVGKSLVGKYIHQQSDRKDKPFIHLNCAAISDELFEAELYGYKKGSFTGASKDGKVGLAEVADGGTLFLDEITEIPYSKQAKLLQFIQEKKFYPVGSTTEIQVDVRIVAATNKNIEEIVKNKGFREDLYYRLNVFEIDIPPLRNRREDILLLADYFLNLYNQKYNRLHRFSKETRNVLENYSWRGNIRELSHVVERLVVLTNEVEIVPMDLPKHFYELHSTASPEVIINKDMTLDEMMKSYEAEVVRKTYEQHGSTRKLASKLGISQTKAVRLCKQYIK